MKQGKLPGNHENAERNIFLLLMLTILILYMAAPLYGVIRDEQQGDAVFRIENPASGTGESLPDKIIDFFFGSKEIPVPVVYIVDLEGTVIYSDKTPYSNGLVELRSTPQYTRTTKDGYFIFRAVETGAHEISVLDESGKTLASCSIDISVGSNTGSLGTVSFSRNTYTVHVPVNVKVLEIKIMLERGEDGSVSGVSGVEVVSVATEPSGQPGVPGDENPQGPEEPQQPIPQPPEGRTPESPTPGAIPGGGSPGGGGGGEGDAGGPIPGPFHFSVYDRAVSFGSETAQINIFGTDKRIAPGKRGSYRFTVDNSQNDYSSLYTVAFTARDTLPGDGTPMVYRLKAGNSYVVGDADTWCDVSQLDQDRVIQGNSSVAYTLEWRWAEGENDNLYAEFGGNSDYSYSLRIEVTAQRYGE
jgi:hypothetical protein